MKRVLIFSVAYTPFIGGAEIAVQNITNRLSESIGFDLITLNLDGRQPHEEMVGNVHVYRIGGKKRMHKLLYPFAAYYLATRLHKKEKYDATWSIMASFSGFAALFFKLRFPKIPFILTLQEGDPYEHIRKRLMFMHPVYGLIFKYADRIQAISRYLVQFAQERGARGNIEVIPNGVDLALFSRAIPDGKRDELRKKYGLQENDRVIITTSRLVTKNAVDVIIKSLTHLSPEYKLLVVGSGEQRAELEQLAKEKAVGSWVHFVGQIEYDALPEYLSISHVFARPSRSEGMGNSFIEAMAAGVPVIGTNIGGIPDFLRDQETGLFCEVDNPEDLAEKISLVMYDEELRARIVENAKRLAKDGYGWEYVAKEMKTKVFDPAFA